MIIVKQDETTDGAQVDRLEVQGVNRSPITGGESQGREPEVRVEPEAPDEDPEAWSYKDIPIPEARPAQWENVPKERRSMHGNPHQQRRQHNPGYDYERSRQYVQMLRKEELRRKQTDPPLMFPVAMAIVLVLLGALFIHGVVSTADSGDEDVVDGLRIEEVFFVLTEVREESITVDITIYITNTGNQETGVIDINSFAIKTKNNIVYDEGSAAIQKIGTDRTAKAVISMDFQKNESYRIDILTFDDHLIGPHGYGQITTGEVEQNVKDFVNEGSNAGKEYANGGAEADMAYLGGGSFLFCGMFFIPVIIITMYIGASKRGWC